jgi:hypothetical protein
MKHTYLLLASFFLINTATLFAQCPTCTPDLECISPDGLPTICPLELPAATAGEYYEDYLTFYLPANVTDPESGIEATLQEIQITSVTGMPFGMEFTMNDPDNTYYPGEGENHGCATICGTPILEGVYDIIITVNVLAVAFGFEIEQNQQFIFNFVVNPGDVGNASFEMSGGPAACGQLTVDCEGVIDGSPSITTYSWNFGNGETSDAQDPGPVTYTQAGDYVISLTTTISDFVLSAISVSALSDNWSGDLDDFFSDSDTFFVLTDGDGNTVYSSSTIDNNNTPSWSGFSVALNNPPYTISFTDDDDITSDDGLGSATINVEEGTIFFNSGNGTMGTGTIGLQVSSTFENEESVSVFGLPDPDFNVTDNVLSYDDPELSVFVWSVNGNVINDQFNSSLTMISGGQYSCTVTNIYGCSATSGLYLYCPEITPLYNEVDQIVYVEDIYSSYQWSYNGLPVDGAEGPSIDASEPGNYSVEVTTSYGCTTESSVLTVTVGVENSETTSFKFWPNPVDDVLSFSGMNANGAILNIYDSTGRKVISEQINSANQGSIDTSALSSGSYTVEFLNGEKREVAALIRK